jgi:centromere/kinetochore protein ZW10
MYLYNDSLYLAEKLRGFVTDYGSRTNSSDRQTPGKLNLHADIKALELFGKRAYVKEMETQRTIVGDLLDGAQGFIHCTDQPFTLECENAVDSIIDRIRHMSKEWSSILSRSALLQSLGSLLSTVTNKFIVDVEDMSDISEPESQRLAQFCGQISKLNDLFLPEQSAPAPAPAHEDVQEIVPLTAVYTPNWLKFQYLASILESSLADIKYLWQEGELRLEFSAEEVVDLIEALFADSEHRRKAIGDIRRTSIT